MGIQIAPSILSADFANLAQEARRISNADWLLIRKWRQAGTPPSIEA